MNWYRKILAEGLLDDTYVPKPHSPIPEEYLDALEGKPPSNSLFWQARQQDDLKWEEAIWNIPLEQLEEELVATQKSYDEIRKGLKMKTLIAPDQQYISNEIKRIWEKLETLKTVWNSRRKN